MLQAEASQTPTPPGLPSQRHSPSPYPSPPPSHPPSPVSPHPPSHHSLFEDCEGLTLKIMEASNHAPPLCAPSWVTLIVACWHPCAPPSCRASSLIGAAFYASATYLAAVPCRVSQHSPLASCSTCLSFLVLASLTLRHHGEMRLRHHGERKERLRHHARAKMLLQKIHSQ